MSADPPTDLMAGASPVVALLRLPIPVAALGALATALERAYGAGLVMHQPSDGYLILSTPGPSA